MYGAERDGEVRRLGLREGPAVLEDAPPGFVAPCETAGGSQTGCAWLASAPWTW